MTTSPSHPAQPSRPVPVDQRRLTDQEAMRRLIALKNAPVGPTVRRSLKKDLVDILACAQRKNLVDDPSTLRREAVLGTKHFELACWLYFYSDKVGTSGTWARIDCVRRLLLSDYPAFSPSYDFHTVFNFGERQFDTCFEMGDSSLVMQAIVPLRTRPRVAEKFAQAGWTEDYLLSRGLIKPAGTPIQIALHAEPTPQGDLFSRA